MELLKAALESLDLLARQFALIRFGVQFGLLSVFSHSMSLRQPRATGAGFSGRCLTIHADPGAHSSVRDLRFRRCFLWNDWRMAREHNRMAVAVRRHSESHGSCRSTGCIVRSLGSDLNH